MQDEDVDRQTQKGNDLGQNKESKVLEVQNGEDTNRNTQDGRWGVEM